MCKSGSAQPQTVSVSSASVTVITDEIFTGYISDIEEDDDNNEEIHTHENLDWKDVSDGPFCVQNPPPPIKQWHHNIPIHFAWKRQRLEVEHNLQQALITIEKAIASKKKVFEAGRNGLQEYRAQAIQSHLHMVVNNGRKHIDADDAYRALCVKNTQWTGVRSRTVRGALQVREWELRGQRQ